MSTYLAINGPLSSPGRNMVQQQQPSLYSATVHLPKVSTVHTHLQMSWTLLMIPEREVRRSLRLFSSCPDYPCSAGVCPGRESTTGPPTLVTHHTISKLSLLMVRVILLVILYFSSRYAVGKMNNLKILI